MRATSRRQRALLALLLGVAPLALAGCAALHPDRPHVDLVDVGLENVGLLRSSLAITLRVENPNGFRLSVERGAYTLFLGGERIGTGATRAPLDVPAHGTRDEQIVIDLDNARLLSRLRALLGGADVDYRVEADHYLDLIGWRERPLHSVAEGRVDLRHALRGLPGVG